MKTVADFADAIEKTIPLGAGRREFVEVMLSKAMESAFRAGFEHAVAGGEEGSRGIVDPAALPVVLYFRTEEDRRALVEVMKELHDWTTVKIPERKS